MQQIENMKEFCIQENDSDQRLDRFLQKTLPELPKSLCYKWIRTKHIKVNRKRCTPDQRLVTGDVVTLFVSDSYFTIKTEEERSGIPEFMQAPDQLDILYEDAQILVVNKPVGLVVHCDSRQIPDTLVNRVLHYLYRTGAYHPEQEQSFTPALCNRLDRNTGGIVIAAKTAAALREVNRIVRIVDNLGQTVQVGEQQVRTLIRCKTAGETDQQRVRIDLVHQSHHARRITLVLQPRIAELVADIVDQLVLQCHARIPDFFVGHIIDAFPNLRVRLVLHEVLVEVFAIECLPLRSAPCREMHTVRNISHVVFFGEISFPDTGEHLL